MERQPSLIFAVDDEQDNLDLIRRILSDWVVRTFVDPGEALEKAAKEEPLGLVVDYRMPHLDGVQLVRELRSKGIYCGTLMLTGFPELNAVVYAEKANLFYRLIPKPFEPDYLRSQMKLAIEEKLGISEPSSMTKKTSAY